MGLFPDFEFPGPDEARLDPVLCRQPHFPSDAANLLTFLTSLRSALGSSRIISAAVPHLPWLGSNGQPLTNISAYAAQMTYINIMNYDVWGASSNPGPNAPLGNLCGTSSQPTASAQAALSQWTAAGAPASKLLLGLPLYGYVSNSTKTKLTGSFAPSNDMVLIQKEDSQGKNFLNGAHPREQTVQQQAANADLRSWSGQQILFNAIVSSGALVKLMVKVEGSLWVRDLFSFFALNLVITSLLAWDDCSDTPFLFNTAQSTVVTYDDTFSLGDKATFARQNGMAGCFTWSLDQYDGVTLQTLSGLPWASRCDVVRLPYNRLVNTFFGRFCTTWHTLTAHTTSFFFVLFS
ncbi:glycoside hydrolase [Dendrothele bispora CBS 962.96]|uniref:Glycoside hydrolase n=1 Tax=Dendrothele bispora (strain CBS 962.96) TaxID=1314807 RepID=A0A4S8LXI1_DENBC|nr:glycoside hydrolase [Dendrothele bispora CBS 962.96]